MAPAVATGAASRSPGRFSRSSSPNAISAPNASAAWTSWTPVTAVWVTDQISSRPANATSSHRPESGACACALRGSYRPAAATSQALDRRQRFLGGRALRRPAAQSFDGGDEGIAEGRVELVAWPLAQLGDGLGDRPGAAVGPVGGHRVE